MKEALLVFCVVLFVPAVLRAQTSVEESEARFKALEERVRALEAEVQELRAQRMAAVHLASARNGSLSPQVDSSAIPELVGSPDPVKAADPVRAGDPHDPVAAALSPQVPDTSAVQAQGQPLPNYGGASAASKILNPDISMIGDFIGATGKANVPPALEAIGQGPLPVLQMHESELGLQAIIDPYARGDFFLTFGESGVALEEGYITFTALPGGFVAKGGKFRGDFGKVNTLHNHVLPWIDRPLVTDRLLAGEDGIDDAGLSVTRILPAPKGIFLEGTAQVFRGDSGDVFTSSKRGDASVLGHLRAYRDITDQTNLDLGISYARGHNDLGSAFLTDLYGLDATLRWTPLRRTIYHNFVGRAEFVWSRRDQLPLTQRAFGFFTSGDYRLNRRWTVGGRFDRSGRARAANLIDDGFSGVLTYWPSEFSQVRGQYRFTHFAEGPDGNELLFQFIFVLGAHGAHPF
ncbi:MAG: hypothetical protein DMG31_01550 [Acidobacteria bacterium]|nr:MAG: hypothetical protein DMG31_01550 [Acidobacteriota bacterium]